MKDRGGGGGGRTEEGNKEEKPWCKHQIIFNKNKLDFDQKGGGVGDKRTEIHSALS